MATATKPVRRRTPPDNRAAVSGIVLALEKAWVAIHKKFPNTAKDIAIVVASKGRRDVYGYHAPQRWDMGAKGRAAELLIAAEYLKRPARQTFTTLLHEAVHSSAFTQDISDTSQNGRYHNRRFALIATGMGLVVEQDPKIGHITTDIDSDTYKEFRVVIDGIAKASKHYRHADVEVRKPPNKNLLILRCDCEEDNHIRASRRRRDKGIICSECGTDFEGDAP